MITGLIIGVVIGTFFGLLLGKNRYEQQYAARIEVLQAQAANAQTVARNTEQLLQKQMEQLKADAVKRETDLKNESDQRLHDLTAEKDRACQERLQAQQTHHQEAMQAQQQRFDQTMEKITAEMKLATDEMLKQRQKEFAESSNTNLGRIVTPLMETIDKMQQAMTESTIKQTELSSALRVNITDMMRQSEAAKNSTDELTRVFKHRTKVQGDWGETVLDEILQSQGLTRGVHYDTQAVIRDAQGRTVRPEEGSSLRPDVILHLDQRREVIIDSKVSMTSFMDYVNADNEETRRQSLKLHVESLQKHVKELHDKDYSSYIQPPKVKMDYVIMFVPHSGALWTALNARPDLWRKAMEQNVFIADEQTLFAATRIINLTWTQIAQAQNHEKVYDLAKEMLNRVGLFVKHYENIGTALGKASKAYDDAKRQLQPGGQSILQTCGKLIKLGAKPGDKNPLPQLTDIDEVSALEE